MKPTRFDYKIYSHPSVSAWDWLQDPQGNSNHRFSRPWQEAFVICCFHLRGFNQLQIQTVVEPASTEGSLSSFPNCHTAQPALPERRENHPFPTLHTLPLWSVSLWGTKTFGSLSFYFCVYQCLFFFFFNMFLGKVVQLRQLSQRFTSIYD